MSIVPGLVQARSLVFCEFFQSIGKVENVPESGTLYETFGEDRQLFIAYFLVDPAKAAGGYGGGLTFNNTTRRVR